MVSKRPPASDPRSSLLAELPAIHRLLATPALKAAAERIPASVLADAARHTLGHVRAQILGDSPPSAVPDEAALAGAAVNEADRRMTRTLRGAINATGIVLHTGLGRARLADAARDALIEVASSHSTVEIDASTGRRGSRRDHVRSLLCELTGAEDATVVNNCAGAVFLAVSALAAGREVIISRGELVEIGGAFRMPDIIRAAGAVLVEVGTTNRTRLSDYIAAITERTGLILRCHPSNYAIVGFTEHASLGDLAMLGRERGIPVMDDQGSGALILPGHVGADDRKITLQDSVAGGCTLITASGDKLLGGPQAGLVLGQREYVERVASHPLARALRVDKFTLAALEATLRLYREPERAKREIPTLRYLLRDEQETANLAKVLSSKLAAVLGDGFDVETVPERSQVGGGSLPGEDLETVCVAVRAKGSAPSSEAIASHFRSHKLPIFARIKAEAVLFDPRTLELPEIDVIADAARGLVL